MRRKKRKQKPKPQFKDTPKWTNVPKDINKHYGFIYKITHIDSGKFYIGKKFFWFKVTKPPLKGNKNKRHSLKESDWKTYWGSSKKLWKDIEKLGEKAFKREIILLCDSKWDCAYQELLKQLEFDVLFREDSYNECVNIRLRKIKSKSPL